MDKKGPGLSLENVCVRYGPLVALEDISITVEPGETVALIGPSGAGKSTLLGLFNGSLRAHSGSVRVDDKKLSDLSASQYQKVRSNTGFVHQSLSLVPNIRVIQNVVSGDLGHKSLLKSLKDFLLPSRATTEKVYSILELTGIEDKLYEQTDRLSGGQQQRVAIARALYQSPGVLLCDEPVSSVDPSRARAVIELLLSLAKDLGLTLVVSLHNLDLARQYFPRIIALREGRIQVDKKTAVLTDAEFEKIYRLAHENVDSARIPDDDLSTQVIPGARFG